MHLSTKVKKVHEIPWFMEFSFDETKTSLAGRKKQCACHTCLPWLPDVDLNREITADFFHNFISDQAEFV